MSEYTDRNVTCEGSDNNNEPTTEGSKIDLTIGVFFDGTLNNKYNIDYANKTGKVKESTSYDGSYSNIAELYECYQPSDAIKNIYIEGIGSAEPKEDGTSSEKDDYSRGYVWGTGMTGINAKIARGCKLIAEEVSKLQDNSNVIGTLTLDVFGFSRGAAAARSFVSQIEEISGTKTEGERVSLRQWLTIEDVPTIEVRFLGLFDTVSSFNPGWGLSQFDDDVPELSLTIPKRKPKVQEVVHLVAADEYRQNFTLTTIGSAGRMGLEVILPGAHSDIGGGYNQTEKEDVLMNGHYNTGERQCRGYMSLQQLRDERWISPDWYTEKDTFMQDGSVRKYKDTNRYVENDYAKIPLAMMGSYAKNTSPIFFKRTLTPDNLTELKTRILSIANGGALLYKISSGRVSFVGSDDDLSKIQNIRAKYIHLSAHNIRSYVVTIPHIASENNMRLIIVDGQPPTEIIDSPINPIKETDKMAILRA